MLKKKYLNLKKKSTNKENAFVLTVVKRERIFSH